MTDLLRTGPSRPVFYSKIFLALAWILAGAYAAAILMRETSKTEDVLAAVFLIVAPIVWCISGNLSIKNRDEMEQKVLAQGLSRGLLFANVWSIVSIGAMVLTSLFLGAGEVNVSGIQQRAVIFICIQPAMAFLMSEATSFSLLRKYAKHDG